MRSGSAWGHVVCVESTNEPHARLLFSSLRQEIGLRDAASFAPMAITAIPRDLRDDLETELGGVIDGSSFFTAQP